MPLTERWPSLRGTDSAQRTGTIFQPEAKFTKIGDRDILASPIVDDGAGKRLQRRDIPLRGL
jgi:hypothetical protein